jgi:hypothetical protein
MLGLFFVGVVNMLADKVYNLKFSRANWGVATSFWGAKESALKVLLNQLASLSFNDEVRENSVQAVEYGLAASKNQGVRGAMVRVGFASARNGSTYKRLYSKKRLFVNINNREVYTVPSRVCGNTPVFSGSFLLASFIDSNMPVSIKKASEVLRSGFISHTNTLTRTI